MPRFHIQSEQIKDGVVRLSREESRHAISVLRLKAGDAAEVFDGLGKEFPAVVIGAKEGLLSLSIGENSKKCVAPPAEITIAASVIKPERMELMIQKACELGVYEIVPLLTERSVVRLSRERWESKIKRWQKIAVESCKQCGRAFVPKIHGVGDLRSFMAQFKQYEKILIPTLAIPGDSVYGSLKKAAAKKTLVLIGPEGDFTKNEVEMAIEHGAQPVTLGPLVMRSETAAIYILSILNFFIGRYKIKC